MKLIDWVDDGDSHLKVLSIVGMQGIVKSSSAGRFYSSVLIKFKKHALVEDCHSLTEDELLKYICRQLLGFEEMVQLPRGRMKETIKERLQNERYLIVLINIRRTNQWDQVKDLLPKNNCGSRVLITTPINEVAKYCVGDFKGLVYNLQPLSETDSWKLFCDWNFGQQVCPSNLELICRQVLKSCGGFPPAIWAISLRMAGTSLNIEDWDKFQHSFNYMLETNGDHGDEISQVAEELSSNFYDLPYALKSCYKFISVFPQDHFINSTSLIRLWISEGFVEEKDGSTLEEVASSYLEELLNRNLLQIAETRIDGRVRSYRINNMMREMVIAKSRQQRFVNVITRNQEYTTEQTERARRLSIHYIDGVNSSLLSGIRSLFLTEAHDTSSSSSKMPKLPTDKFKLLNVLDLTGAPLCKFPEEITKLLLLRYLSLRNTQISKLPKSIGRLRRLEILDLKQTLVTELPSEISRLQELRHLLICRYRLTFGLNDMMVKISTIEGSKPYFTIVEVGGFKVTPSIGGLLSLQKLCFLEAPEDSGLIKVLERLTQLRRLCLVNLRDQHWSELCSSISKMTNLRSLTLHTNGSFELQSLSSPPPLLERLYLTGRLDELPSWLYSLQHLRLLHLMFTKLKKDHTVYLESMPSLAVLVLCEAFDAVNTSILPDSFSRLEVFGFGRNVIVGVRKKLIPSSQEDGFSSLN